MKLYSGSVCLFSHACRFVLRQKDIECDVVFDSDKQVEETVAELNPYGETPTLADRELVLYDGIVVSEYLDERFPHPPLLPVYPVARAQSRLLIHRVERDWCGHVDAILAGEEKEASLNKRRKELREAIIATAPIFSELPYFMSEEFTLVDCVVAPILWRLPALGIELPAKQVKPLLDYAERLFDRDAFQASLTEAERELRNPL